MKYPGLLPGKLIGDVFRLSFLAVAMSSLTYQQVNGLLALLSLQLKYNTVECKVCLRPLQLQ